MKSIPQKFKIETCLYEELAKKVDCLVQKRSRGRDSSSGLRFSIFEDAEPASCGEFDIDSWMVKHPAFDQLFTHGECIFRAKYESFQSKIYTNPTWADIVWEAHRCVHRDWPEVDHVFLESVKYASTRKLDGVKIYDMWFGS